MRIILVFLCCLLLSAPAVFAGEPAPYWTPEMARMLAREGWDRYTPKPLEPVVGFEVHFVELSAEMVQSLSPQFSIGSRQDQKAGWEVSWDTTLLKALNFDAPVFRLTLEGSSSQGSAGALYSSWMVTVGNQPLYVNLSETNLTSQGADKLLQIRLTPLQIDQENERILTQFALTFSGDLGAASQVEMVNWVESEAAAPVAVVAKSELASGKEQTRYFALLVSGFIVPPDRIPGYMPIVSIGDFIALQRVFSKAEAKTRQPSSQWGAGLVFDSRGTGGYLSGSYAGESGVVAGLLQLGHGLSYSLNTRWLVHEHLALLAAVEERADRLLPVFRLGIGDVVWLTPNFNLNADLYALEITARESDKPPVAQAVKVEFGCAYESEVLSISYKGTASQGELSHRVKSTVGLEETWSLEMTYGYSKKEKHQITLGLTFSVF